MRTQTIFDSDLRHLSTEERCAVESATRYHDKRTGRREVSGNAATVAAAETIRRKRALEYHAYAHCTGNWYGF